ncbi:sigma-70 family RNA polymerase sigma factor [Altericista sp. CCNU0014]|uniref:sigma-70 family RNA polymerase sigma factor n=1 Tax=Altericista sp. CCNU0014 TaxID=3082949 RepID=UPI00384BDAAF
MTANTSSTPPSDAELVGACQCGRTDAFRELYRRHQKSVRAMLGHLCDPDMLEDLVQEVFIKAWNGLPKMRGSAQFSTWLYRIAWNVGADYRRSMAQKRKRMQQQEIAHATTDSATNSLQHIHHRDLVRRGLQHISSDHAIAIVLHDLQDIPQAEIADILQIPIGTVKSRVFHARQMLRQFFHQEGISL